MLASAIGLVILLVAGGTMAWFTATAPEATNVFEAGTVAIVLHDKTLSPNEEGTAMEETDFPVAGFTNVNPGDKFDKIVYLENIGSKRAFVRIKLTPSFDGGQDVSVVTYPILNGWILHTDGWYYYPFEVAAEAFTPHLIEEVIFAGLAMDNGYQGAKFTLKVEAEAIQVTNGAALDQWLVDPLTLVP